MDKRIFALIAMMAILVQLASAQSATGSGSSSTSTTQQASNPNCPFARARAALQNLRASLSGSLPNGMNQMLQSNTLDQTINGLQSSLGKP